MRGAPGEFGEYFRLQVGQQIYPALVHLDAGLAGAGAAFDTFADLLSRPDEARMFTAAQHAGSHAAARVLAARTPLDGARHDAGRRRRQRGLLHRAVRATTAACMRRSWTSRPWSTSPGRYRDEAGLGARIDLLPGDAVHTPWPPDQDVILLSYLLSALGDAEIDVVLAKAQTVWRPAVC